MTTHKCEYKQCGRTAVIKQTFSGTGKRITVKVCDRHRRRTHFLGYTAPGIQWYSMIVLKNKAMKKKKK